LDFLLQLEKLAIIANTSNNLIAIILLTFILLVGNKFSRRNIRINLDIATSFCDY